MPIGGGDPKKLRDGLVVKVRPDYSRGGADLWDTRDAVVALCEELDKIYAAAVAHPAVYADFVTHLGGANTKRTFIKIVDGTDSEA